MQKTGSKPILKKIIALILGMTMILTMFSSAAFADDEEKQMCKVTVTNGASSADIEGEAHNSIHVYDENDPALEDFTGEKEFEAGAQISYYVWAQASDVKLTVVHNGVTVEDRVISRDEYMLEEPKTITLEGDLSITTEAVETTEEASVTVENKVGGDPSVSVDGTVIASGDMIAKGTHTFLIQGDFVTDELMSAYVTLKVNGKQVGEATEIGYDDAEFADVEVNGDVEITIAPYEEPQTEKYTVTAKIAEDVPGEVMIYADTTEVKDPVEIEAGTHSFIVYGDYTDGQENASVTLTVGGEQVGETVKDLNGYTGVEFTDIEVAGDVVITVSMPKSYTVRYENKVADETVMFNVMTVDFSGGAPAPKRIEDGDALEEESYVGVQVLNPTDRKLIVTQYNEKGKVADSSVIDPATEAEEGAGGIIIPALDANVKFVLSYAYTVKVSNGAAAANTDYNVNGLHVYSLNDPELMDIEEEAVLAEGTPIEIYAYPTASAIHIKITHNGEVAADKDLDMITAWVDDDKIEWFNYELAGDLEVVTSLEKACAPHEYGADGYCVNCGEFIFTDVPATPAKLKYVSWAYKNGIVTGTGANTFSPDDNCTRAQFVMMLWKMNGSQKAKGVTNPFSDVKSGTKTCKAVLWALKEGIITSGKNFNPSGSISRSQIVMMLWKMAGSPAVTGDNPFTDIKDGSKLSKAVLWAYQTGITKGTSSTTFAPDNNCTRLQLVTFLFKYNNTFKLV